eukprot:scaffold438221_cov43-Prasinocladus_malaysianus.AAC.1
MHFLHTVEEKELRQAWADVEMAVQDKLARADQQGRALMVEFLPKAGADVQRCSSIVDDGETTAVCPWQSQRSHRIAD